MHHATHLDTTDQKSDSLLVLAARPWRSREGSHDIDPGGGAAGSRKSAQIYFRVLMLLIYGKVDLKLHSDRQTSTSPCLTSSTVVTELVMLRSVLAALYTNNSACFGMCRERRRLEQHDTCWFCRSLR